MKSPPKYVWKQNGRPVSGGKIVGKKNSNVNSATFGSKNLVACVKPIHIFLKDFCPFRKEEVRRNVLEKFYKKMRKNE